MTRKIKRIANPALDILNLISHYHNFLQLEEDSLFCSRCQRFVVVVLRKEQWQGILTEGNGVWGISWEQVCLPSMI